MKRFLKILAAPIVGVAFILSGAFPTAAEAPTKPTATKAAKMTQADINVLIDQLAPSYGLDPSLVKKISLCEDQGNPYSTHANKHGDEVWSTDIGPLQINDFYHESEMKAEGLDIRNPLEGLKFGLSMMKSQGTIPWNWSRPCWKK